jgi:hypothetical protein
MRRGRSFSRAGRTVLLLTSAVFSGAVARVDGSTRPREPLGTYYVAVTGADADAGTKAAPFRTIQWAASLVNPGDVVVVGDGVYTDDDRDGAVVRIARGGTAGNPIVFRAANRWGAKLDGENGRTANGVDVDKGVGYVRIEGFEISGFANVGAPRGSSSGIDLYDGGHDTEIIGNHIHHIGRVCTNSGNTNGQVGIFVEQPNVIIDGNLIHDIGRFSPGENGCRYTERFTGYQTLDHGIYLNGGSPGASGAVVRNNIFHTMRRGWAIQFYPGSLRNVQVLNNTFAFGNPYRANTHIVLDAKLADCSIVNNIFFDPDGGRTIEAEGFSGAITISHNVTTGTAMTDRRWTPAGMTLANNRLATDPMFLNAPGDFRLRGGSPAIDAGQMLAPVRADFAGRPRPHGARFDIGAHEH